MLWADETCSSAEASWRRQIGVLTAAAGQRRAKKSEQNAALRAAVYACRMSDVSDRDEGAEARRVDPSPLSTFAGKRLIRIWRRRLSREGDRNHSYDIPALALPLESHTAPSFRTTSPSPRDC